MICVVCSRNVNLKSRFCKECGAFQPEYKIVKLEEKKSRGFLSRKKSK